MNEYLIAFIAISLSILAGVCYFLRGTIQGITSTAAAHAKTYSVAYVKGGALILIAAGAAFETGYQTLAAPIQNTLQWAPYAIFFWKPIAAGLAVLVAFLDRSAQNATKEAEVAKGQTNPPIPPKS